MEKRLLLIYVSFCILLSCFCLLPNKTLVFDVLSIQDQNSMQYIFHTSDVTNLLETSGEQKYQNISILKNGDNFIVKCEPKIASLIKRNLTDIQGESITFVGNKKDAFAFLSKFDFEIVLTENVAGVYTLYAFVPTITNCIYINNQKVNLELAVCDNIVTIGCPIILGDY